MSVTKITALLFAATLLIACDSGSSNAATPGAAETAPAAETTSDNNDAKPEPDRRMVGAVKSRRAALTVLKDDFVPLALMAGGRIDYDAEKAQRLAKRLPVLVSMLEERFEMDTRGSGVETEALDSIWEDMDAFKGKIMEAQVAADKLAMVAGDEAQFKEATMAMRSACGSCHDDFRVEQN